MKQRLQKFWLMIKAHKIVSAIIIVVLAGGGYYAYAKTHSSTTATQYVLGQVTQGDLVVSVTGTGQVATQSKVELKPQTTGQTQTLGQVISVKVKNGDQVKAGQVIAILDGKAALQSLNQARSSVASAQANYDKLANGPTENDLLSTNQGIQNDQVSISNNKQSLLNKIQTDYFSAANAVYVNTDPMFMNPSSSNPTLSIDGVSFTNQVLQFNVQDERLSIGKTLQAWKQQIDAATTDSDLVTLGQSSITSLTALRTYFDDMTTLFSSYAVASSNSSAQQSTIDSDKSTASSARSTVNSGITDITSAIQTYQSSVTKLQQDEASLAAKKAPANHDDLVVAQAQLDNAKANYANAAETYASRIITAPFDGQIGGLTAQVGMQVSSNDVLGTLITPEKVINVSLNEVDAAKVKASDAVKVTFDALPNVTMNGHVVYVDPLGTVTQGVVSYAVQIGLDGQNDQVQAGMTASVTITADTKANVLMVPVSAIVKNGNQSFVLVPDTAIAPTQIGMGTSTRFNQFGNGTTTATSTRRFGMGTTTRRLGTTGTNTQSTQTTVHPVPVVVGISNDTQVEIVSGLTLGQQIVTRTITGSTATTQTTANRGIFGLGGGAGGTTRAATGGNVQFRTTTR